MNEATAARLDLAARMIRGAVTTPNKEARVILRRMAIDAAADAIAEIAANQREKPNG